MIIVKVGPLDHFVLDELETIGWTHTNYSNGKSHPVVHLKSGRSIDALDFTVSLDPETGVFTVEQKQAAITALLEHINKAWRMANGLDLLEPMLPTSAVPPDPVERAVVDRTGRLVVHDTAGAHSDDPRAIARCEVCTPFPA